MKKILFIIGQLSYGGSEKQLYELALRINKKRFKIEVISLSQQIYPYGDLLKKSEINLRCLQQSNLLLRFFELVCLIKSIKPDLIQFVSCRSFTLLSAYLIGPIQVIFSERSLGVWKKFWLKILDRMFLRNCSMIVVNAKIIKQYLLQDQKININKNKIVVIYNGIEDPFKLKKRKKRNCAISNKSKIISIAAGLRPWKDHFTFLDSIKIISQTNPDFKYIIAGDGILRNTLEDYSKMIGVFKKVNFLGWVENTTELFEKTYISVITSTHEGLCNSIIESMIVGTPVVATNVGGNCEIIDDVNNGVLVPVKSPQKIAETINELIKNTKHRNLMAKNARKIILEKFDMEKMINKFEKVFDQCLEQ